MNRGVIELGHVIRSFRLDRKLTQFELSTAIGTTRTAIALMEQGRRLLDTEDLQKIAQYLQIPTGIVAPFLTPALQSRRNKAAPEPASVIPFHILCVSGITGSGKSTLAGVIARTFGISLIDSSSTGRAYLDDLANNQSRWAFEAQVAFLVSKTAQIREKLDGNEPFVVERWIDEDILIYEKLFEETGAIGPRSSDTFKQVIDVTKYLLPIPEYHFYCQCTPETAFDRVHNARKRSDSNLHSLDYINHSKGLYECWLDKLSGPEVYVIDTDVSDLSKPGIMEEVFREIQWVLTHDLRDPQMSLFDTELLTEPQLRHVRPFRSDRWSPLSKPKRSLSAATPLLGPVAYLAAPFSGKDVVRLDDQDQALLFEDGGGHGVIPRAGFRNDLLGIERALSHFGLSVLLPHRDVNEWGRKQLSSTSALKECTEHVEASDLFVGILANSCGAHYEFGLALAAGKPCILIETKELSSSFLASGASVLESPDLIVLSCNRLVEAEEMLRASPIVTRFIERHVGLGINLV